MISNFRGKNTKDVETPTETVISYVAPKNLTNKTNLNSNLSVTDQQLFDESFDTFIEKRRNHLH